jgi:MYXO-CTERM domain-containing protein
MLRAHFAASFSRPWRRWLLLALSGGLASAAITAASAAWPPLDIELPELRDPEHWPTDPDYGCVASEDPDRQRSGQWPLYSFVPDRNPDAPPVRPSESAAGMSVDAAFRLGVGEPSTLIAVLGSGIVWNTRDLLTKVALNPGELAHRPPLNQAGESCAPLVPSEPDRFLMDCDGDGFFTVADYRDDATLLPHPTATSPRGDANRNGVLDAGDLVALFANGTDDDGNGYTDDIAGWDFLLDRPDPVDLLGSGHGTESALLSAASTNNGVGGAGACPGCRIVPLRVALTTFASPQAFGEAVAYATDLGAAVILAPIELFGMSTFAQAALGYAWSRGVLVVTAAGKTASNLRVPPNGANHLLSVSGVTLLDSSQSTSASSFLALSTCSNHGSHVALSASTTGCADEAAAYAAGVAALLHSMSRTLDPGVGDRTRLTSGELRQLMLMTADDVDVAESREPSTSLAWSQPGYDLHFGHGRLHAARAAEWLADGRIPPDVEITKPAWSAWLDPRELGAPVKIHGSISARRATSYDYSVEWASGSQPLDVDFKVLTQGRAVPATRALGADGAHLAELDVRELSLFPERTHSTLDRTGTNVTIRVRAAAYYEGHAAPVKAEVRRTFAVTSDADLVHGFPIALGASVEASPKLHDLDGDGVRDIVVATSDGLLHAYSYASGTPRLLDGFPVRAMRVRGLGSGSDGPHAQAPAYRNLDVDPELAREPISATPAIADLDGDGSPEIVFTTVNGTIHVVGVDGKPRNGWPQRLPYVPPCASSSSDERCTSSRNRIARGALASPVLADLNADGRPEIIQAGLDGAIHVYGGGGIRRAGWPVQVRSQDGRGLGPIVATPAVADLTGDGIPDLIVASSERLGDTGDVGAVYVVDGRGSVAGDEPFAPNWPVTTASLLLSSLAGEGVTAAPAAADIDHDGQVDAIIHGNGGVPLVLPGDPGRQASQGALPEHALPRRETPEGDVTRGLAPASLFGKNSNARAPDMMVPLLSHPSVGDLDQDGVPDVVASGASLVLAQNLRVQHPRGPSGQHLLGMWSGRTGTMLPGSPSLLEDYPLHASHVIADINADGYPEVIVGSGGYLRAIDACGREAEGFPKRLGDGILATPAVGDVTGNGYLEVVVATRGGHLYAFGTRGRNSPDTVIAWESRHHDNRNTGSLATPLEQGTLRGSAAPLALDDDGRCKEPEEPVPDEPVKLVPAGGCACRTSPTMPAPSPAVLAFSAVVLLAVRRRRRREPTLTRAEAGSPGSGPPSACGR